MEKNTFLMINDMIYVDGSMPMPEQGMDAAQLFAAGRLAMAAIGPNSVQNMLTADFTDWDVAYLPIQDKENGSHIFGDWLRHFKGYRKPGYVLGSH